MSKGSAVLHLPARHVHPRCRPWWTTRILIGVVATVAVPVLLGSLISPIRTLMFLIAGAVLVLGIGCATLVPAYLMRNHRWDVNEIGVYSRRGWIWQEWRAVPFARLQTVDVTIGPIQRLFGLATVTATTASAKGPVLIEALDTEAANNLAAQLTERAQAGGDGDGT